MKLGVAIIICSVDFNVFYVNCVPWFRDTLVMIMAALLAASSGGCDRTCLLAKGIDASTTYVAMSRLED
jgi:hypothetical protein